MTEAETEKEEIQNKQKQLELLTTTKSKLQTEWSFWFFKHNKLADEWRDNLMLLADGVDCVEDFWSVHRFLKPVDALSDGCDYMVFKKGVVPMWEDENCVKGGRIYINITDKTTSSRFCQMWLSALLTLIGSGYDHDDDADENNMFKNINGLCANIRTKSNKLAIWTNNFEKHKVQQRIGKIFLQSLKLVNLDLNESSLKFESFY